MKTKRILCFILSLFTVLSAFSINTLAASEKKEVADNGYELRLLKTLNIITDEMTPDGKLPDRNLTRGEFVEAVVRMMDMAGNADTKKKAVNFTDIDDCAQGWAIDLAFDMGIVKGYEYGLFLPNKDISLDEVSKILVSVLGYDGRSRFKSYYATAKSLDLFNGINTDGMNYVSWNDCVKILFNTLDAEVMTEVLNTGKASVGDKLLKTVFNVECADGIIEENELASLRRPEGEMRKGYIVINDMKLLCVDDSASDYLGYNVRYYYKDNGKSEKTVIMCYPYNNRTIKIDSEDLGGYADKKYTYFYNDLNKTAMLTDGYALMYNGRLYDGGYKKECYLPKSGYVMLLDNNNDGRYDVVFSYDYINRIVKNVNTSDEFISFDYDGDGIKSLNLIGGEVKVYKYDGSPITLNDIKKGDSVSVAVSGDEGEKNRLYTIYASSSSQITGVLTLIDDDKMTIKTDSDEKVYKKDSNPDNIYNLKEVKPGDKETFYLNIMGRVFASGGGADNGIKTAFCIMGDASGAWGRLKLKLLTSGNNFIDVDCAESLTVSGPYDSQNPYKRTEIKTKDGAQALKLLNNNSGDKIIREVIRYKINEENEINYIETAVPHYGEKPNGDIDLTGDGFHYIIKDFTNLMYSAHSNAFMPGNNLKSLSDMIFIDNENLFFTIPENHGAQEITKAYAAIGTLENDKGKTVKLYATAGDAKSADITVIQSDSANSVSDTASVLGVNGVYTSITSDGTEVVQIDTISKKGNVIYQTDDADLTEGIDKGDLIRISTTANGDIQLIEKLVDYDSSSNKTKLIAEGAAADGEGFNSSGASCVTDSGYLGNVKRYMYGAVFDDFGGRKVIALEKELDSKKTSVEALNVPAFTGVLVFNGRAWQAGSAADVYDYTSDGRYSMVFARLNYANAEDLYVYNLSNK